MGIFLQCIISGIAQGAIYSLVALGYSIIYSTMKMGHFAQGDFFMFGAYVGWQFCVQWGVNAFLSIIGAIVGTSLLMLVAERITYRPMYSRPGMGLMISTMGMQYIVQEIAKLLWGTESKKMPPMFGSENKTYDFKILGETVKLARDNMFWILICGALMFALALFMKYTKTGIAMSAVSMNRKAAQLMGVKLTTIISTTYIMAAALAAIAGVLMAPRYSVVFTIGTITGNKAMTSAVMGGFGSLPGAMVGGVLMGIIETLCSFYISSAYKDLFTFIVLIIILFWRPQGILGRRSITKV